MFPPQTLPHSNVGSRFENGRLCLEANGPNLSGCYLINTTGGGGVAGEVEIRQACR